MSVDMEGRIFKRKIYRRMLEWKTNSAGRTALLIKGARRVGKSTIAEAFARREYKSYVMIDFSIADASVKELFSRLTDLNAFFLGLQSLTGVRLEEYRSVVIFDEVQLFPAARQAIKHLVKDGRYDYIETGSLLSIKKNVKGIVIPSEETRIEMHPMDYEEFLWAIGKEASFDGIRAAYEQQSAIGDAVNRALLRDFRLWMLVGGMPQAVNAYVEGTDFCAIDEVKRNILELYADDLRKIDSTGRAARIFRSIPGELAHGSHRYMVGRVIKNATTARLAGVLADIDDSMTVSFAYQADDPATGMAMHADHSTFKIFLADTGLFVTLAFWDSDYTENDLYRRLLSDKLRADLGYVYENAVAQLLRAAGHRLFFHAWTDTAKDDEGNTVDRRYEIDFIIGRGSKICPIEVKSSGYKSHRSLDVFLNKYSRRIDCSYLAYTKDLRRDNRLTLLPVYMTGLL